MSLLEIKLRENMLTLYFLLSYPSLPLLPDAVWHGHVWMCHHLHHILTTALRLCKPPWTCRVACYGPLTCVFSCRIHLEQHSKPCLSLFLIDSGGSCCLRSYDPSLPLLPNAVWHGHVWMYHYLHHLFTTALGLCNTPWTCRVASCGPSTCVSSCRIHLEQHSKPCLSLFN